MAKNKPQLKKLKIISISDIHLGHNNVPASFIINNLNKLIPFNDSMADVDIIFLAGDVFDQQLFFSAGIISEIELWMVRLMRICEKYDIKLRILEGTPSHDRGQSKHFEHLKTLCDIKGDIKYIPKLSIEYMSDGTTVLYVPDEYHATTFETWTEVQSLLLENNLQQVDYAVMHGMFEHQMPAHKNMQFHNSKNYLDIVRKYIFIGHVHHMSVNQRILSQGSTDRLNHGEEEDKGIWMVTSYADSFCSDELTFVKNEGAKIFKTVNLVGVDIDDTLNKLEFTKTLPRDSWVRVITERMDIKTSLIRSFQEQNKHIHWSMDQIKNTESSEIAVKLKVYQPIIINLNSIESIVNNKLNLLGVDDEQKKRVLTLLTSIKA